MFVLIICTLCLPSQYFANICDIVALPQPRACENSKQASSATQSQAPYEMAYIDNCDSEGLASFAFEMELNELTCKGTPMPGEHFGLKHGFHEFCCSMHEDVGVQPTAASHACNQFHVYSQNNAVAKCSACRTSSAASDGSMASSASVLDEYDAEYSHAWASIRSETSGTQPLAEWMEQHFLSSIGSFRSQSPVLKSR